MRLYVDSSSSGEEDGGGPQQRLYCRRGSMPEREIDAEDTETAALQSTLRRYNSAQRLPRSDGEDSVEDRGQDQTRARRGGSNPEREVSEDDAETAELQSNLRRLAAAKAMSQSLPQLVTAADTMAGAGAGQRTRNKTIFRPVSGALRAGRGRGGGVSGGARGGGLRRSRTWQGFTNGLRYESVSDAGMPPPPPSPPCPPAPAAAVTNKR